MNKILTHEEYILYDLCLAISDWDKSHETYGTFQATNQELATILGWSKDSTVSRHKSHLIKKKFLWRVSEERFQAKDFMSILSAKKQTNSAENMDKPANLQDFSAEMQKKHAQTSNLPLVSSKGNLGMSLEEMDYISEEELDKIAEELDKPS